MKKLLTVAIVLLLFASCQYKDLCYDHNHEEKPNLTLLLNLKLDLDIDLDVTEEAHTKIEMPSLLKVCFYDTVSGALLETDFVGAYGGPIHVSPGVYKMVVYSFDTEWTWIRGDENINTLEAFTSDITDLKMPLFQNFSAKSPSEDAPGPIIYTPDHLLVTDKIVEIPPYSTEDYSITITAVASTIVETYGFEVTNVTGIEYISSVEAFVTNQARSNFFGRGEKGTDPATIYFPVEVNKKDGTIKSTFNTFGKLPGESYSYLHIVVIDAGGNVYSITQDITDQFDNPEHMIEVDEPINIPPPESSGGGIAPTVDPWEEENHDVPIG